MKKHVELPYPTILLIDSGDREQLKLVLIQQATPSAEITAIRQVLERRAQELMVSIEDFLAQQKLNLQDISALAVLKNGQSLTGTRMGLATANTLGWLLTLPIIEINSADYDAAVKGLTSGNLAFSVVKISKPAA